MLDMYSCPNCNKLVDPTLKICNHCGMNLAIAAVIAETAVAESFTQSPNIQLSPEILVPRLGDYLVKRGLLTDQQLKKALSYQKSQNEAGNYILLGRILIERNYIGQSTLDSAITEQIVTLQDALQKSNSELELRVKERTAELQQALKKITELNQLKTNFISNISHELRTPLTHMVGYLELFRDGTLGAITEDQTHAITILLKSYNRLHGLIDELIQFSFLSQGEMSISQQPVQINDLIESATTHASNLAHDKSIELVISNLNSDTSVLADKAKISWVIGELIENGIKFNNPGGKVLLKVTSDKNIAKFHVIDNGIGISQEQLEEIFLPFHQLDGSSTRRYGGTGIGLALAKQIIEAHGSSLKAVSLLDRGTSFEFTLPEVEASP